MNGDGRREQFAMVPRSWFDRLTDPDKARRINYRELTIGGILLLHNDPRRQGSSCPSIATIARILGVTTNGETHVRRALHALDKKGLIKIEVGAGPRGSNRYHLLDQPPANLASSANLASPPGDDDGGGGNGVGTPANLASTPPAAVASQSDHVSDQLQKPSPAVKGDDALASSLPAPDADAEEHDAAPQLTLDGKPARHATKRRTAKKGGAQTFEAFKAATAARVEALDSDQIRYLKTKPRFDVSAHFAMQFMGRKVDTVEKVRAEAVGLWPRILNVTAEPKHPHFADVTVGDFLRIGRRIHALLEGADWTKPWEVVGWGTQIPGAPEPERHVLTRAELGLTNPPKDRPPTLAETLTPAEQEARRVRDEATRAQYAADDAAFAAEHERLLAHDETADADALPMPGNPLWVREIAAFERRLATAPLADLARERGDRKRLGALHAVLFDPAAYEADDRDETMRTADRYAEQLEPLCQELRAAGNRAFTVRDYCDVAVELLDQGGSAVSVERVVEASRRRALDLSVSA